MPPLKKKTSTGPQVLDLFAGAGGFSLGFHWAGFETFVAIDHDPTAVETLDVNFGHLGTVPLLRDLAIFGPSDLRAFLLRSGKPTDFDVVVGGPPCQGWSVVGRGKLNSLKLGASEVRRSSDPRNNLYKKFIGFVEEFQPRVAVMENVPGMLSHNNKNEAEIVAESMERAGYRVVWQVLNAFDYGVPQIRERLFFVGVREDLGIRFEFPPSQGPDGRRLYPDVKVWEAIGDLPRIENGAKDWCLPYKPSRRVNDYARRMRQDADSKTIFDHVVRNHNAQDLEAFRFLRQGGRYCDLPANLKRYRDDIFKDKYRKLYAKRPSWCLTAHLGRDCYSHIHPTQARTISVREAARLQSFPDCFYLAGNMGTKFGLIGNAVPPLLAEKIAMAIKRQIFEKPAKRLTARTTRREQVALA